MAQQKFEIAIPQARLDDLRRRLERINWPTDVSNDDWSYGVPRRYLEPLCEEWRTTFDWRAQERRMNELDHFRCEIEGMPIHFVHERGRGPNPIPIVLSHGWPWTFWDFKELIPRLTDPAGHGGDASDCFHVVVPSLPGFVFSAPLTRVGVGPLGTARIWDRLMRQELGYERYAAHGGDWGAMVTTQIGHEFAEHVIGVHMTNAWPVPTITGPRPWSIVSVGGGDAVDPGLIEFQSRFASHLVTHMLHGQTLSYALHDSPVGLLAWMLEKRFRWGDCRGNLESRFSRDHLLTTMSLYWLTDSFVSSARYYAQAQRETWTPSRRGMPQVPVPTALSLFRHDLPPGEPDWTKRYFDLRQLRIHDDGGHFGPIENPAALVEDIRSHFRPLR